ncbi:YeeE/YedE family protein [Roseivirga sp. 4D4]|uniref:YeeE/YedE family protein n=1 Tax=Roseivirga sp. 4D4 TaxID=1889784 RepID=UPI000852FEAF|nr:YeeE/YedE thiosulfate transporter family protein [Roseivirga sp. 4D4]OEK00413.1 YeeE/YedE family protein [Roseivirga sp. 4D4]
MLEFISQPWPWYVAGPVIAFVMFGLIYFGNSFGMSANFRNICSIMGAGKSCDFFDFDWRKQMWNIVFVVGTILGGVIASQFLMNNEVVAISDATVQELTSLGVENPGQGMMPESIFNFESLLTAKGLIMIVLGGFLVGFGTRYAGGCTSGHAISGLSDLQPASLLAVIGFFAGGLLMTWLILPSILTL